MATQLPLVLHEVLNFHMNTLASHGEWEFNKCELRFSLRSQLLERNYYYAVIDSVHITHVSTQLCSCNQRWASYATWSLLPVTPFNSWWSRTVGQHYQGGEPVGGRSNCRYSPSTGQWRRRQIATISKYAAENGNAAALGDSRLRMTSEKHCTTIQEALLAPYKNHVVGGVKHSMYKM